MSRLLTALTPLLLCGCMLWSPPSRSIVDDDTEVLDFAGRIERFYRALEQIPLDVQPTFTSPLLRSYFRNESDFASYYASLVNQVRRAQVQNSRLGRIEVREFQFRGEDRAEVQLILFAQHERRLRFWMLELERNDTWRREAGIWVVAPGRL